MDGQNYDFDIRPRELDREYNSNSRTGFEHDKPGGTLGLGCRTSAITKGSHWFPVVLVETQTQTKSNSVAWMGRW